MIFKYSIAKRSKVVANTAKVVQFPLRLCFAATAHGFQGQTVYKPTKCACDFRTVFEAAQSYVMLSRVEALNQLYIIGHLPDEKFYASGKALRELERMDRISVNRNPPKWEQKFGWSLKLFALNCQSLKAKIIELQNDPIVSFSDVIILCETWLKTDVVQEEVTLAGYELHLNSFGEGKGLASYYKAEKVSPSTDIMKQRFQITKLVSPEVDIISVYRSSDANNDELMDELKSLIGPDKTTVICGDFNECVASEKAKGVAKMLEDCGFTQLVTQATHLKGGHIDHVYSNHDPAFFEVDIMLYSPYYTCHDHDALCITIRKSADNKIKMRNRKVTLLVFYKYFI